MTDFDVRIADWSRDLRALREIRTRVFIEEQHVPKALEWDDADGECLHALAFTEDQPIGTGRLTPDAHIGRMAVLPEWRGRGVGARLLQTLLTAARERGESECRLMSQFSAIGFYERFGFQAYGDTFLDAGIVHRNMVLNFCQAGGTSQLHGHAELAKGLSRLVGSARYAFTLYAPDLAPRLADRGEFIDALRTLALSGSRMRIRLLCENAQQAARSGHGLLRLAAALPSRVAVHRLAPEDDATDEVFAFNDRGGSYHQSPAGSAEANLALDSPARAHELAGRFEPLWERSEPDPEARLLRL
ncbi:MAG: GNAT family N-acetyltransferase [Gammaproteobacteria bacterium]